MMHAGAQPARNRRQFIARVIVPGTCRFYRCDFPHFTYAAEPGEAISVCYRGTARADKMPPRFDISPRRHRGEISMTLTVAHISPIISVIAGLLILIMPRLLNLIVAIFLIVNGLIGLGLLKWLHM